MSKNIKGKNIDINLNITQSGTFNAEIFNASNDFTLNGFSIVSRIINNETNIAMLQIDINEADAEIVELQNNKQDKLTIQQSITPSTTEIASASAIINYVNSQVPEIIATPPLSYSSGTLSGIFDLNPTLNSINFLNSGKIYNALQGKQNTITSATPISCSYITASNAVTVNNGSITCATGNIQAVSGNITTATGSISAPTILQGGTNLLTTIQSNTSSIDTINTTLANKQDTITQSTDLECGLLSSNNLTAREGNIFCLLGDIRAIDGDILTNTGTISTLLGTVSAPIIIQDGVNLLNEINTKQDILNIIQTITTSQTSIPSSYAVFNYLDGVYIPQLVSATAPINYSTTTGIISGSFDLSPTIGSNNFLSSGVISSALSGKQDTITSATNINCNFLTTNNIEVLDPGSVTTYSGNIQSQSGDITTSSGDISTTTGAIIQQGVNLLLAVNLKQQQLVAGQGITLTPNNPLGYTTISASLATTSTQYAFQATSNQGGGQTISSGTIANFNLVQHETPAPSGGYGYSTASKKYVVPESGRYLFGFKLFSPTNTLYNVRVGIFVNGSCKGFGGDVSYTNEAITCILEVNKGDGIDVRGFSGSALFYMASLHSWWFGYRLEPVNNAVSVTTDLDCKSLTALETISGLDILQDGVNLLDEINTKQNQLIAGPNIVLSPSGATTEISVNIPSIQVFTASLSSNITGLGAGTTSLTIPYNNVVISDSAYSYNPTTGILTILVSGRYAVNASINIDNAAYADRVGLRARLRLNSSWSNGDPQGYGYARHNSYVMYASATIPETIRQYSAGETLDVRCDINKASTTNFTSDFNGIDIFNGCIFSVRSVI